PEGPPYARRPDQHASKKSNCHIHSCHTICTFRFWKYPETANHNAGIFYSLQILRAKDIDWGLHNMNKWPVQCNLFTAQMDFSAGRAKLYINTLKRVRKPWLLMVKQNFHYFGCEEIIHTATNRSIETSTLCRKNST
ncbi:MAG TPA: hypothetical protein VN038_18535, partial [Dyadobacter sp.]|nr:hypothetical protein [Dyadobacter sp.]